MTARGAALPDEWVRQAERIAELSSKAGKPIAMKEFAAEVFGDMEHGQMRRRLQLLRQRGLLLAVDPTRKVAATRKATLLWTAGPVLLGEESARQATEAWRPAFEHAVHLVALSLQLKRQVRRLRGEDRSGACNGWRGAMDFAIEEFGRALETDPRLANVRRAGESAQRRRCRGRAAAGVA